MIHEEGSGIISQYHLVKYSVIRIIVPPVIFKIEVENSRAHVLSVFQAPGFSQNLEPDQPEVGMFEIRGLEGEGGVRALS